MKVNEKFEVWGHQMILGTHKRTFEFTKSKSLTWRGDCVIGVKSTRGAKDLKEEFKVLAKRDSSIIKLKMEVNGIKETVWGMGDNKLTFTHKEDMVVRKSRFVCGRTLMISSNKAAKDLPRDLFVLMRNPNQRMIITLTVYPIESVKDNSLDLN